MMTYWSQFLTDYSWVTVLPLIDILELFWHYCIGDPNAFVKFLESARKLAESATTDSDDFSYIAVDGKIVCNSVAPHYTESKSITLLKEWASDSGCSHLEYRNLVERTKEYLASFRFGEIKQTDIAISSKSPLPPHQPQE